MTGVKYEDDSFTSDDTYIKNLTKKEISLFFYLCSYAFEILDRRVFYSKSDIYSRVWNYQFEFISNV